MLELLRTANVSLYTQGRHLNTAGNPALFSAQLIPCSPHQHFLTFSTLSIHLSLPLPSSQKITLTPTSRKIIKVISWEFCHCPTAKCNRKCPSSCLKLISLYLSFGPIFAPPHPIIHFSFSHCVIRLSLSTRVLPVHISQGSTREAEPVRDIH